MPTTHLSTKGQVVIPRAVRERHRWKPGQAFEVVETAEGVLLQPEALFRPTTFDEVGRALNYQGPPIPVEKLGIEAINYRDLYPDGP